MTNDETMTKPEFKKRSAQLPKFPLPRCSCAKAGHSSIASSFDIRHSAFCPMNNLRYAFRQLRKAPGFTLTALATVAICLGANLAIFAVINSILLRPLPFPQSDRLVKIFNTYPKAGVEYDGSSITNYYERRGNIPAFSSLSLYAEGPEVVGDPGSTEQVQVLRIEPDFFATLGVNLAMGR